MGCFVPGVKKWHGMFSPEMFCPAPAKFVWVLNSFLASCDFCPLLTTFAFSLEPDLD